MMLSRELDGRTISGKLHVCVAFDWGEEVDLAKASQLVPAESHSLPRRRRTPASIVYRPAPLRYRLASEPCGLVGLADVPFDVEATVFDFGAVNVTLTVEFQLKADELTQLAGSLSQTEPIQQLARRCLAPLFEQLTPAITNSKWSELSEEYFVFQLMPSSDLPPPADLLRSSSAWLAGLLRLESSELSPEEITEATRQRISYRPIDLVLIEWAAAVVIDSDCDETLQTIEFANLQLLEFRFIDLRVDEALTTAYGLIHPLTKSRWPLWRNQSRSLRVLGDMRIEADTLYERTTNALKLVGDQYVARLYRLLAGRFHLDEWSKSIHTSLDAAERVYQILADQANAYRIETLEIIVVVLIFIEIVLGLWRH